MRMRAAAYTFLGVMLLLPGAGSGVGPARAADGPPDGLALPRGVPRTREFQARVDGAIDRGVAWLRKQQKADGSFNIPALQRFHVDGTGSLGPTALGVYAMRACGAGFEDEDVARGIQWLRERYDAVKNRNNGLDTYGVSLTVLALEAHWIGNDGSDRKKGPYEDKVAVRRRIPDRDLEWLRALAKWLERAQNGDGGFSYWSPAGKDRSYDNSNSQYALLALKAARRCGVEVRPETFWLGAEHFLGTQERKGPETGRFENAGVDEDGYGTGRSREVGKDHARGWGYVRGAPATGSMTAGGVSSLVICRSELVKVPAFAKKLEPQVVQGIRDGIAWLGRNFAVDRNPGPPGAPALMELWHHYYLYGLERAGVMAGVSWMTTHDWYGEGALHLLDGQKEDGYWLSSRGGASPMMDQAMPDPAGALLDTCFALLFLKRATFTVEDGAVATEAGDSDLDLSGAADLDENSFRAVFTVVFRRYRRGDTPRRTALAADFVRMGTGSLRELIRGLESADEGEREAAADALQRLTGRHGGYRADAPEGERNDAVAGWETWWMTHRGRLKGDVEKGTFGP